MQAIFLPIATALGMFDKVEDFTRTTAKKYRFATVTHPSTITVRGIMCTIFYVVKLRKSWML